ncbi:hypothetical protein ABKV78_22520 [Enterobacter asburiae]|nr:MULTISPECIES: hypothetical protein [Enterobacter]MDU4303581.1 hypothetical protein [Enterococcus faecalis]MCE1439171.1 hypothetical protein [Enterobacter hormaechei]MCF2195088.1 hypothetical protein [Enterobacter hormaechei]MCK6998690.1 hypothetical protein [Enterobacter kobei]MCK7168371.1 hypothetical protein [Enterobacter chengduensis]
MKFISNWQDLPSLLLPDSVMTVLRKELILPFDDELSAMNFWCEVGVTLMYIEPGDVPEDIKRHVLDVIHHLIANPEFVVHLTDEYYLMLSITEDNGNGIYLLFHPECPLKGIDTLMSMAESRL